MADLLPTIEDRWAPSRGYSDAVAALVNVCFHGIGVPARDLEPGEAPYWVSHEQYVAILDLLVGDPRVRISFDDGNASDIELGLPGLQERGLAATFFVLAGRLDQPGSLGSDDVRALVDAGMTIGTHGMDHVPWRGLDAAALSRELVEARSTLTSVAGRPVDEAALPLGRYDRRLLAELRRLGYRAVHTSDRAWARPGRWLQPRFSVHSDDTVDTVRQRALTRPSRTRRLERAAVTTVKRWR